MNLWEYTTVTESELGPAMQNAIRISKQATFCNSNKHSPTPINYIHLHRLLFGLQKVCIFPKLQMARSGSPILWTGGSCMPTISVFINCVIFNPLFPQSHKLFWAFWPDVNYCALQFTLAHFVLDLNSLMVTAPTIHVSLSSWTQTLSYGDCSIHVSLSPRAHQTLLALTSVTY